MKWSNITPFLEWSTEGLLSASRWWPHLSSSFPSADVCLSKRTTLAHITSWQKYQSMQGATCWKQMRGAVLFYLKKKRITTLNKVLTLSLFLFRCKTFQYILLLFKMLCISCRFGGRGGSSVLFQHTECSSVMMHLLVHSQAAGCLFLQQLLWHKIYSTG